MMNQKAMNQKLRVCSLFLRRSALDVEPLLPSCPSVEICSRFPLRSLRAPVNGFPTFWSYLVRDEMSGGLLPAFGPPSLSAQAGQTKHAKPSRAVPRLFM